MKLLSIVLVIGFLGVVSCDMKCMHSKFAQCFTTLALRYYRNPICSAHSELDQCLKAGARSCGVENTNTVKEVLRTYAETCTPGTSMNAMFLKHQYCVFMRAAAGNSQCLMPTLREIRGLGYPGQANYEDKVLRIACKNADTGNRCVDDNTRDVCGQEALEFRRNLSNPAIALSNEACALVSQQSGRYSYRYKRDTSSENEMPFVAYHAAAASHQVAGSHLGSTMLQNKK
ncbi:uncharacterized protein TNIN_485261 [Trichonephila inaurata madagascariensis]|uniref:Uncharacterized protein n=1 Tax=Trichonephila inaurata madagascariensis TaxID=2747483 RepID=A0A8X6JMK5_9ARAC|nr:uncharacterized protein TNIN_485261 [Trichonephila inaurata madagascariensis]